MRQLLITFILTSLVLSCDNPKEKQKDSTPVTKGYFWTETQQLDEFGDPVQDQSNISATIKGKKDGKETKIELLNNANLFAIALFNPGSSSFVPLPNEKFINIRVKIDDAEPYFIEMFMMNNLIVDTKGIIDSTMNKVDQEIKFAIDLSRASQYHSGNFTFSLSSKDFYSKPIKE